MTTGFASIGVGMFGKWHATAYQRHPLVDFRAICDLDEARAKEAAELYGAAYHTTKLDDILNDDTIKAVSVATPDHAHRDVAVACAKAGKHILVEKPLATTVEDAEAIVNAAREAGVILMTDFHNRANPPMVAARNAIRAGDIGKPSYIYTRLSNTIAVPQDMLKWSGHSSALWFLGSHMVDVVNWMIGDEPESVYVVSRKGILNDLGIDAPDFHVATVEYKNGAVGVFEHAWILPNTYNAVKDLKLEILGSKGAISIDGSHNRMFEVYTGEKGAFMDMVVPPFGPHLTGFVLDAVAHFIETVVNGAPLLADGQDGLNNTRIISAMLDAADTGQRVKL